MWSEIIVTAISLPLIGCVLSGLCLYYFTLTTKWCRSKTCLLGKTVIVTGANTGIGFETAADFAKRGARVILACRNLEKGEEARRRIIEETGNPNILLKILDMASFESVRNFAKDINKTENRLDILVNNAGCIYQGDSKFTDDGLNQLMKVNHFSVFLLTLSLLDLLKKSPSRIITLTSVTAKYAKLKVDDLHTPQIHATDYANSKLCVILFTRELAKRLKGTEVTIYSVHPGAVKTAIFENGALPAVLKMVFRIAGNSVMRTAEQGAQTSIYLAVTKGIEKYSGENFINCQLQPPYEVAIVPGLSQKLWKISEETVGLQYSS